MMSRRPAGPRFRLGGAWLALVLALGFAREAPAATVRAMSLEEHVALSESVIRGRVLGSATRVIEGMPFTDTSIEVIASLKGARKPGEIVRVRQLGGPIGTSFLQVPGDAAFQVGEEVIVFLHEDGAEASYLTALSFSKYTVLAGEGGPLVLRDLGNLGLYLPGPGGSRQLASTDVPVALPLFEQSVRELAGAVK